MKKQILFIPIVLLLTLVSCEKDEVDEYDIKASKMEQIGSLFYSIARQPEAADVLIKSAEMLYYDYKELLPISDMAITQRGKARGASFSMLFEAIAMQPEAHDVLDSAAEKFLGKYDPSYINDELLDVTKTFSASVLIESIARQPEADSLLNLASIKYLNFDILAP